MSRFDRTCSLVTGGGTANTPQSRAWRPLCGVLPLRPLCRTGPAPAGGSEGALRAAGVSTRNKRRMVAGHGRACRVDGGQARESAHTGN